MSEKKRFHPLALVLFLFQEIKNWFFLFIVVFINGGRLAKQGWLGVAAVLVLVAGIVGIALVRYFTQAYQISPEKIIIYSGVFRKHETDIPYERIQTVKQKQWFFLQPFHIVELLIETAGGGSTEKAEASMPAVNEELVHTIENYRLRKKTGTADLAAEAVEPEVEESGYTYHITNGQILLFGLTDLSMLTVAIAVAVFFNDFIPADWVEQAVSASEKLIRAGWLLVAGLVALSVLVLAVLSVMKSFFQYYNFKISRQETTLTIESGLLERRVQKIPLKKIQGIKIRQQLIRKLLGISSVELLLAGGQEEKESAKIYFLPIIADTQLYDNLQALLPEWEFTKPQIRYASRKKIWYFWRWPLLVLLPVIVLGFYFNFWAGLAISLLLLVLLLVAWLEAHYQGYAIQTASRICIQTFTGLSKVQTVVEREKIQSFTEKTTRWLFKKKIGHIKFYLKTGTSAERVALSFIDKTAIDELKHSFLADRTINRF